MCVLVQAMLPAKVEQNISRISSRTPCFTNTSSKITRAPHTNVCISRTCYRFLPSNANVFSLFLEPLHRLQDAPHGRWPRPSWRAGQVLVMAIDIRALQPISKASRQAIRSFYRSNVGAQNGTRLKQIHTHKGCKTWTPTCSND